METSNQRHQATFDEIQKISTTSKQEPDISEGLSEFRDEVINTCCSQFRLLRRSVTHDVKGILNSISLNLELLTTTLERAHNTQSPTPERFERYIKAINEDYSKISKFLLALFDLSPNMARSKECFEFGPFLKQLLLLITPFAHSRWITLQPTSLNSTLMFHGSRFELAIAMMSFLIRIIEDTKDGAALFLGTRQITTSKHIFWVSKTISDGQLPQDVHIPDEMPLQTAQKLIGTFWGTPWIQMETEEKVQSIFIIFCHEHQKTVPHETKLSETSPLIS